METRFILPVTFAAAVHGVLLFGVRWPHDVAGVVQPSPTVGVIQVVPPDIRDEPTLTEEHSEKGPKGTAEARPTNGEPVKLPDSDAVLQPPTPSVPYHKTNVRIIEPGDVGRPDGSPEATTWGPGDPVDINKLDRVPRTRVQVAPIYPVEARHDGRTAEVVVEFTVDEQGWVNNPRVVRSTDALFEQPTLRAVAKWRFEPGRKNGRPVRFRMLVPVSFALNG